MSGPAAGAEEDERGEQGAAHRDQHLHADQEADLASRPRLGGDRGVPDRQVLLHLIRGTVEIATSSYIMAVYKKNLH